MNCDHLLLLEDLADSPRWREWMRWTRVRVEDGIWRNYNEYGEPPLAQAVAQRTGGQES